MKIQIQVQPVLAHQDVEEPEIKEFRDENGNLITFGQLRKNLEYNKLKGKIQTNDDENQLEE